MISPTASPVTRQAIPTPSPFRSAGVNEISPATRKTSENGLRRHRHESNAELPWQMTNAFHHTIYAATVSLPRHFENLAIRYHVTI